jgi:hypothetical protein
MVRLSRVKLGKVPVARPVSALLTAKQVNRNTSPITRLCCSSFHQATKFQSVQPGPICKVVVHGLFDPRLRLLSRRKLAEMHNEDDRVL